MSALDNIRSRLPSGWRLSIRPARTGTHRRARIVAPDGRARDLTVLERRDIDPRTAMQLFAKNGGGIPDILAARYLSPEVRRRLIETGVGFVDTTGNVRLVLSEPGLFIDAQGADRDPSPRRRPSRTLAGAKAGRVVRALCERKGTWGVRELAEATGVDAGYVSRLLKFLDREALVDRGPRGSVCVPDWPRLIKRWAECAPLTSRGQTLRCIAPRGVADVLGKLTKARVPHAVSGSFAASRIAPVIPPRLLLLYVGRADVARDQLGLRSTEVGSNVLLIEPKDQSIVEKAILNGEGSRWAPLTLVVADLLTSSDRGPAEADALIDWMERNEDQWRE